MFLSCVSTVLCSHFFFFFHDTATTEIYTFPYTTLFDLRTLSARQAHKADAGQLRYLLRYARIDQILDFRQRRSEEHTSELQSRQYLVCRLLLEKKKQKKIEQIQQEYQTPKHSYIISATL